MNTFTEIKNEDFGTMMRCTRCGEVCEAGMETGHVCPPTEEQKAGEQDRQALKELVDKVLDPATENRLELIDRLEKIQELMFEAWVKKLENKFGDGIMKKFMAKMVHDRLGRVAAMKAVCYDAYDDARKKNMPFAERRKILNRPKIMWCEEEEQRLARVAFRPWREWVMQGDEDIVRRLGVRRFVDIFLIGISG